MTQIYYTAQDGSIRCLCDNELAHFNHNHDRLGRFSSGSNGYINARINKIDSKTGKLGKKEAKYRQKASKYQRKANKIKRKAANPLIRNTDFREKANYDALKYEGKGLKYTHKADKIHTKISKLDKERIELGHQRVKNLETQYPDVFEPGWRDKYKNVDFDVNATKKRNNYKVSSTKYRKKR